MSELPIHNRDHSLTRGLGNIRLIKRPTPLAAQTIPRRNAMPTLGLVNDQILAYTDGATRGNGSPECIGGYGVVLLWHGHIRVVNGFVEKATSNIAELTAIETVLDAIKIPKPLVICSDSEYSIGVITKKWKIKKNIELIARIQTKVRAYGAPVEFRHVKGHAGIVFNEVADNLAKRGARKEIVSKTYSQGSFDWNQFTGLARKTSRNRMRAAQSCSSSPRLNSLPA